MFLLTVVNISTHINNFFPRYATDLEQNDI